MDRKAGVAGLHPQGRSGRRLGMFLLPRGGLDVDLLPGKPPVGRLEVEARFRDWGSRGKSGIHVRANVRGIFQLPLHDEDVLARAAHELALRSEEHTSELQSLMRISYAVFCLKK